MILLIPLLKLLSVANGSKIKQSSLSPNSFDPQNSFYPKNRDQQSINEQSLPISFDRL